MPQYFPSASMTESQLVATLRMPAGRGAGTDDHAKPGHDESTVSVRHPAIRARARLERVGGRVPLRGETEVVASLLVSKLAHAAPDDDQQVTDTLEIRRAFLQHRFTNRLSAYDRGDRFYRHLDTTLNLASIAAGIAASLLVASATAKAWTIALAVGIAGCQTLSQWLKPAERAARRGRAASALRREAWDILEGRDRYRGKDMDRAWDLFCDRVDTIEGQEQTSENGESGSTPTISVGDATARSERQR
jgi:hypothetical protein